MERSESKKQDRVAGNKDRGECPGILVGKG